MSPPPDAAVGASRADWEPKLNIRLGNLLSALGIPNVTTEDKQPGGRQIDVRARVGLVVVALEAEIANRAGAIKDAQARLDQALSNRAIAISYPEGLKESDFGPATVIEWAVLPDQTFVSGKVEDLAAVLRRLPEDHGDPDGLAAHLDNALDLAVAMLSANQKTQLAAALDLPVVQHGNTKRPVDRSAAAAKRALLVVTAAAMFHARLDDHLPQLRPSVDAVTGEPYTGAWPPSMAHACIAEGSDAVGALDEAWRAILAVDYSPIFETARVALTACAQNPAFAEAVTTVSRAAVRAARDAAGARHDLLGRIFHRILDSARYDGSFYTSTPAAVLLAALAIHPQDTGDDINDYRVIDPACGTGTLLMAAAERVRDVRPGDSQDDAARMIDSMVWGIDVNTTACHLAATTLGLLAPSVTFSEMNVLLMPLGMVDVGGSMRPRLGSLELLDVVTVAGVTGVQERVQFQDLKWYEASQIDSKVLANVKPNSFSLVIMNPPYTRDSLRHDQFSKDEHDALKDREKTLMAGRGAHGSSAGSMFEILGEHLTDLDNGVLAMVRPTSAATGPAGLQNRKLLAEQFHVEWVISSHDQARMWFSENTGVSEMLVVARRHEAEPAARPPTRFVSLLTNPATVAGASALASALASNPTAADGAAVMEWPARKMVDGDWSPVMFANPWLASVAADLRSGGLLQTQPLASIAASGPAGQRIRDVFERSETGGPDGYDALWRNDTDVTRVLAARADFFSVPKPTGRARRLAAKYWNQRGHLLVSADPRLTTMRVLAVHCDLPTLGSRWVPFTVLHGDPEIWSKAMAVWLNSSLGILAAIAGATHHVGGRPKISLDAMRNMRAPVLDEDAAKSLAAVFNDLSRDEFQRIADSEDDPTRQALDAAIVDAFNLDAEIVTRVRKALAAEPSVQ
ncbi:MAG: class I SAM-dependent methyltransferase [Acidimicrobiaceae bacterium]|nr:class I SAM-dependent methyltransferase [Acidimicrobiaceae bacterium]